MSCFFNYYNSEEMKDLLFYFKVTGEIGTYEGFGDRDDLALYKLNNPTPSEKTLTKRIKEFIKQNPYPEYVNMYVDLVDEEHRPDIIYKFIHNEVKLLYENITDKKIRIELGYKINGIGKVYFMKISYYILEYYSPLKQNKEFQDYLRELSFDWNMIGSWKY